jgi:hypothetical protein
MTRNSVVLCAGAATMAMLLAGCRVEENKHGDGKDVQIVTPFGGMNVKTNDAHVLDTIGLPAYPGAIAVTEDTGNDHAHSADVDMSFGDFKLRVKTADYRTDDAPDKVEAFYRNGLKRFGDVIACRDHEPVGAPDRTLDGLTCENEHGKHISVGDDTGRHKLELKAGSKLHQHIVSIDSNGGGTKFGLVALDLPGNFDGDEDGKRRQ